MLSEELKELIDASLTDGVLTDKERAVIRKRALIEGVDPDEVDLLLDSEVQKIQKKQQEAVAKVRKCPNCGEIIPALAVKCPSCGYEFENQDVNRTVERFAKGIANAKESGALRHMFGGSSHRADFIKSFVIPNNAEDLYELIIYITSAIKNNISQDQEVLPAYRQKLRECKDKVNLLFPDDQRFSRLFEQTKLSWWQRIGPMGQAQAQGVVSIVFAFVLLCLLLALL
jgi:DNA-directed RNA polymerase subunit M/transcription elongation factor TFIIS